MSHKKKKNYIVYKKYYGSKRQPVWLLTFFKISYFVFNRKKQIHTGLEQHEGEWMVTAFLGKLSLK